MKWRQALISLVVTALLIAAGRRVDWSATWATLAHAKMAPLAAATVVNLISLMMSGTRWWIFLRPIGVADVRLALRAAVVGAAANNILIASGGDAARTLLVARATGVRRSTVFATTALDRLFDPLCFCLILVTATFMIRLPPAFGAHPRVIAALILAAGALLLLFIARAPATSADRPEGTDFRSRARELRRQVRHLATPVRLSAAMALAAGLWILQAMTFALVARAANVNIPLAGTLVALLLTNAGLLIRATPGNVGWFQFAYAVAAVPFGVRPEQAVAVSLLIQAVQIIPVTIMGLMLAPQLFCDPKVTPSG